MNIGTIVRNIYKNMNPSDFGIIVEHTKNIMDYFEKINNTTADVFSTEDIEWLSTSFLPYAGGYDKILTIKSISDIYTNESISKIQYTICNADGTDNMEIEDMIYQNVTFIKEAIRIMSNKMYINWSTVVPNYDYKNSAVYFETIKDLNDRKNENGLYFGDIYNTYEIFIKRHKTKLWDGKYNKIQHVIDDAGSVENLVDAVFARLLDEGLLTKVVIPYGNRRSVFMEYAGRINHYAVRKKYSELGNPAEYISRLNGYDKTLSIASQIIFCTKYLNCRFNLVAGATGSGKSTTIPQMYMYYAKAIDYDLKGHVILTEPRIKPTENSRDQIARLNLLGKEDIIRIKHGGTDNENIISRFDMDRYGMSVVTDGILVNKLKDALECNAILIDEAHEHNKNIDFIVALCRLAQLYVNTKLKIVILSATIEEDEHYFRRFFRCINNNARIPNYYVMNNQLDRNIVDPLYWISPPRMGTRAKITPRLFPLKSDGAPPLFEMVKDAIKNKKHNTLVFVNTNKQISKLCNQLNGQDEMYSGYVLPDNVISVPYSADFEKSYKGYGEILFKNQISQIRCTKEDLANAMELNDMKNILVGNKKYSRLVIVSTNISEASVTYSDLDAVVDTGSKLVIHYDHIKNKITAISENVSPSSQVQRKGRVGRVGEGSYYHSYVAENNGGLYKYLDTFSNYTFGLDIVLKNLGTPGGIKDKYIDSENYGHYFVDSRPSLPWRDNLKFTLDELLDDNGILYFLHPEENNIIREKQSYRIVKFENTGRVAMMMSNLVTIGILDSNSRLTEKGEKYSEYSTKLRELSGNIKSFPTKGNEELLIYSLIHGGLYYTMKFCVFKSIFRFFDDKYGYPFSEIVKNREIVGESRTLFLEDIKLFEATFEIEIKNEYNKSKLVKIFNDAYHIYVLHRIPNTTYWYNRIAPDVNEIIKNSSFVSKNIIVYGGMLNMNFNDPSGGFVITLWEESLYGDFNSKHDITYDLDPDDTPIHRSNMRYIRNRLDKIKMK